MLGVPAADMSIVEYGRFNMLTIKGVYGREMYGTWYKMTVMLERLYSPRDYARYHYTELRKASRLCEMVIGKSIVNWLES